MRLNSHHRNSRGFTLVEMSMVLIAMGVVIGVAVKGMELYENSRIKSVVSQIKIVEAGIDSFQESYHGLPGDLVDATNVLNGCDATNFCANGDGNMYVGSDGVTDVFWNSVLVGSATPNVAETTQFWKHLALAGLIKGVRSGADPAATAFGTTHPATALGGGMEYYMDPTMVLFPGGMNMLRISTDAALTGGPIAGQITPKQAAAIDKMIDDGAPNTGTIFVNYGNVFDTCKIDIGGGVIDYNINNNDRDCVLFAKIYDDGREY